MCTMWFFGIIVLSSLHALKKLSNVYGIDIGVSQTNIPLANLL